MHRIFFARVRKTGNPPRRGRRFRRFHPKPVARMPSPDAGKKTGRRGWVALPAAEPATLRGSHRTLFSWGVARPPAPGAGSRSAAGRGGAARREARARRLPGSRGARRSPCFSASGRWSSTATRRELCGFSPLDCQDKPKVDNDGKPDVSKTRRRGAATSPGPASLRAGSLTTWFGSCGIKAGLPDFGERLGGKAVNSHWADQSQDRQDPGADWGKHETTGVGKTGKGEVVVRLHVATRYEIPVAFSVTRASRAETEELDGDKLETPLLRCKDFSSDRGSGPAKLRYGPLHAPRGKRRTLRPNRSSTTASAREARRWS